MKIEKSKTKTLYRQLMKVVRGVPENDLPTTLDCIDYIIRVANRDFGMGAPIPDGIQQGLAADFPYVGKVMGVYAGLPVAALAHGGGK
jgi:hypothetical protein